MKRILLILLAGMGLVGGRGLPAMAALAPPARVVITPAGFSEREGLLIVAQNQGFFRKRFRSDVEIPSRFAITQLGRLVYWSLTSLMNSINAHGTYMNKTPALGLCRCMVKGERMFYVATFVLFPRFCLAERELGIHFPPLKKFARSAPCSFQLERTFLRLWPSSRR